MRHLRSPLVMNILIIRDILLNIDN
jgi:hypothetical protein